MEEENENKTFSRSIRGAMSDTNWSTDIGDEEDRVLWREEFSPARSIGGFFRRKPQGRQQRHGSSSETVVPNPVVAI